jgi:hypothetical protein
MSIDFAPHNMTANNAPSPYVVAASTEFNEYFRAYRAFDGSLNGVTDPLGLYGAWIASGAGGWISLDCGAGNSFLLQNYSIQVISPAYLLTRYPRIWTMEGSNNNSTWITLDTITNQTGWGNNEIRNFTCDTVTDAYRYFRLNVSYNNGGSILEIGEIYLYGISANQRKIIFTAADQSRITISLPLFGYKSIIDLPFDIEKLDKGLYKVFDAGSTYDVRSCECTFELDSTDTDNLLTFIDTTSRGLSTATMELQNDSGFFPFGPDKGDTGTWTVALELLKDEGVGVAPYLYHRVTVRIVNQSTHPTYSLPTQISEGSMTFGTVSGIRFPQGWFKPDHRLGVHASTARNGTVLYVDKSANADSHDTSCTLICNESKAAAIVNYLVGTARANTFSLTTAANQYAFGMRSGSADTYTVRLIQDKLEIVHDDHNSFDIDLALSREAIT